MSKEPDFDHPSMDERIVHKIHEVAGQYTLKILHWIAAGFIGATVTVAGAAIWATTTYAQLQQILANDRAQDVATMERVAAWNIWRENVDAKLRTADANSGDRWRRSHQREWVSELRHANPAMTVPDIDAIANRQTP